MQKPLTLETVIAALRELGDAELVELARLYRERAGEGPARTARARILAALERLEPDALEVLALVAERLALGRKAYGDLRIARDPRDFRREALEEVADALVYSAAELVRLRAETSEGGPDAA